jgi:hypothetical protein
MNVEWIKCDGDNWCELNSVNLQHDHFEGMEGVYIIWYIGNPSKTVRVGQGVIRDRISAHRDDNQIQAYSNLGLFVTWASIPAKFRDGVEAYLAASLDPLVGERFPNRAPIEVNLPW